MQGNLHLLEIVVQVLVLLGQNLVAYKVQLADNLRLYLRLVLLAGLKSKWNDKRAEEIDGKCGGGYYTPHFVVLCDHRASRQDLRRDNTTPQMPSSGKTESFSK